MSNCLCQNTNIIWLIRITFQMQSLLLLCFIFHFLIFKLHQSSSSSLCVYNFFRVIPSWFKKTKRKFFRENVKFHFQTSLVPTPSLLEDEILLHSIESEETPERLSLRTPPSGHFKADQILRHILPLRCLRPGSAVRDASHELETDGTYEGVV